VAERRSGGREGEIEKGERRETEKGERRGVTGGGEPPGEDKLPST
jgi:hypothetical protein